MASCWFFSGLASRCLVLLPGVREEIVHGLSTPIDRAAISSSTSYSGIARVWCLFQRWRTGRRCGDNRQVGGRHHRAVHVSSLAGPARALATRLALTGATPGCVAT